MNRLSFFAFAGLWVAFAAGCGEGDPEPAQKFGEALPLTVRVVDWNPSAIPVGVVSGVVELGGTTVVLGDTGATLFSGGVFTGSDGSVTAWKGAATIPAADGNGTWIAAIDGAGRVLRLRASSFFEPVSDLYGLTADDITGVAALGGARVAFALAGGLAVADGMNVTRYDGGPYLGLAGGGGRAAGADGTKVYVFNTIDASGASYVLAGAEQVVFDEGGKLVVRTKDSLYIEDAEGALTLRYKSAAAAMHGLALSAGRVWFGDGAELAMLEAGVISRTSGGAQSPTSDLVGSPSGDVWLKDGGELTKLAAEVGDEADRVLWEKTVQPVYLAKCTPCHAPGGSGGFELSTYGAWVARRAKIKERVVDLKTMPPAGIMFADADRAAISAWAAGGAP